MDTRKPVKQDTPTTAKEDGVEIYGLLDRGRPWEAYCVLRAQQIKSWLRELAVAYRPPCDARYQTKTASRPQRADGLSARNDGTVARGDRIELSPQWQPNDAW